MDWVMQILMFGFAAFICFVFSAVFTARRQHIAGLIFGVLELVPAAVSSWAWADALRSSGKGDWFLLGILSYPVAGLIFWCMFAVGILCVVWSVMGRKRQSGSAAQA